MAFSQMPGESAGGYYHEQAAHFRPSKEDPDKSNINTMTWNAPSPEMYEYPRFSPLQAPRHQPELSPTFFESSTFGSTQYSSQYLSPVSPNLCGPIHSPQLDGDSFAPASEYDFAGQHAYDQPDPVCFPEHSYVNMYQVSNEARLDHSLNMNNFGSFPSLGNQETGNVMSRPEFGDGFSRMLNSHAADMGGIAMAPYTGIPVPYHADGMDIDHGVPVMTPPEEDNDYAPQRKSKGRSSITRKAKPAAKPVSKRTKTARTAGSSRSHPCRSCDETFRDGASLQDHVQQAHSRPLTCVFDFAGCAATFGSKNEWKRHVSSQHIMITYWVCTDAACARANPQKGGAVFNRKDLFTQHVRRMHVPEAYRGAVDSKAHDPEWESILRSMQDGAERKRCEMPAYMRCPAAGCGAEFNGANSWDERMEHVARHLDRAGTPGEPSVVFGGDADETLTGWAASPQVNIVRRVGSGDRWELVVPLKTTAKEARRVAGSFRSGYADEDAVGEPE